MADDIKHGAIRIITDIHNAASVRRPEANMISRGEVYREVGELVKADLSLARMLDEFDGKLATMNEGLFDFEADVRHDILALNRRIDALEEITEGRTWRGRWQRFRAWWDRGFEKLEEVAEEIATIEASEEVR